MPHAARITISVTSKISCIVACQPDKLWLSHGMYLNLVMKTLHFLNDVSARITGIVIIKRVVSSVQCPI